MKEGRVTLQTAEPRSWALNRAVLVYTADGGDHTGAYAYATIHNVVANGRAPKLDAGVPATRDACAELARALGAMATLGGFLPANLLYLGARSIIWWRAPGPARLFFDTTKTAAGDQADDKSGAALIGERNGICQQPGLVFAVAAGHWYVYAVKGAERPGPKTALLRAPYFNVWASGEICSGNVRLPESLSPGALEVYEKAFFDSRFTHPNVHGRARLVNYPDGPYMFWRDLLDGYAFDEKYLVDAKLSIEGLARRLEKEGKVFADE